MSNFDDRVTLGDGTLNVEGEYGFREKVKGSRIISRMPVGTSRSADRASYRRDMVEIRPAPAPNTKWCSEGDHWLDKDEFSPDARYRDGLHPWCKGCRARHMRKLYATEKMATGGKVKVYRKRVL